MKKKINLGVPYKEGFLFYNLNPLKELLEFHYNMMKTDNDDKVICVTGNTGSGKSTLIKHIFDYYYTEILKIDDKTDLLKFFCHTDQDYAEALHLAKDKHYHMIVHDEAVNILYSKEAITKKNRSISKLFNIIRAKKFYHIFAIPKVWRLDKEIREDRLKGLINVIKSGRNRYLCYYSAKKLPYLFKEIEIMRKTYKDSEHDIDIKLCRTKPTFTCEFPNYKGWVDQNYDHKKEENMNNAIDEVYYNISEKNDKAIAVKTQTRPLTDKQETVYELLLQGKTQKEIAQELGKAISNISDTVGYIRKKGYSV
jgi:DNA-binding CsgD family transcriptional regulator